jgi:hypothetical protein
LANGGQITKEPQKQAEKPSANGQTDRDLNSKKPRKQANTPSIDGELGRDSNG